MVDTTDDDDSQAVTSAPPLGAPWPYDTRTRPTTKYVLESFELDGLARPQLIVRTSGALVYQRAKGWTRSVLAAALTDRPGALVQLLEVADPKPEALDANPRRALQGYIDLYDHVTRFQRTELMPTNYFDPGPGKDGNPDGHPPILVVHATVRDGAMARLCHLKKTFFKPFLKMHGWRLVFAGHSLTGPQSSIVNVWTFHDETCLAEGMNLMAQQPVYLRELAPLITDERQELYRIVNDNPQGA